MKFETKGFKKAASVGVLGSVWLLIAALLGIIESQGSFSDGGFVINLLFITVASAGLTLLTLFLKKEWLLMLIPALSWVLKEMLKQVSNVPFVYDFELFATAVLFAIPVGSFLYLLVYIKKVVRL